MNARYRACAVALLLVVGAACGAPLAWAGAAPDTAAMRGGLEMMRRTERAFARTTAEIGVRNGFLMFFTDDALSPPDSTPARARFLSRPAPGEAPNTTLEWEPLFGDVSRSLDLGYLTGPFDYLDSRAQRHHGVYFSIWRRGEDGLWRVVLDAGIGTPAAASEFADGRFRTAAGALWPDSLDAAGSARAAADLRRVESEFLGELKTDASRAYAGALAGTARLHRDGHAPLTQRDSILAFVAGQDTLTSAHVIRVETSRAGDLGWTFGICTLRARDQLRSAGFTRVWKRDREGRWRLAVDVLSPSDD